MSGVSEEKKRKIVEKLRKAMGSLLEGGYYVQRTPMQYTVDDLFKLAILTENPYKKYEYLRGIYYYLNDRERRMVDSIMDKLDKDPRFTPPPPPRLNPLITCYEETMLNEQYDAERLRIECEKLMLALSIVLEKAKLKPTPVPPLELEILE